MLSATGGCWADMVPGQSSHDASGQWHQAKPGVPGVIPALDLVRCIEARLESLLVADLRCPRGPWRPRAWPLRSMRRPQGDAQPFSGHWGLLTPMEALEALIKQRHQELIGRASREGDLSCQPFGHIGGEIHHELTWEAGRIKRLER